VNPFQGHLAIGVAHYLKLKKITLISRDLLSLKYSQENLSANQIGSEIIHTSNLESGGDVLIWRLDKDDNSKFIEKKVVDYSKKFNWMVVAGDKKEIQKVAKKNNPVKDFSLGKFMAILLKNRR
jgi:predicted amino acid dehydrogenase